MNYYFSDIIHANLLENYIPKWGTGMSLVFTREWRNENLPESWQDRFDCLLLDSTDGKTYNSTVYVAYENHDEFVLNSDYQSIGVNSLMGYFYGSHHCPCHRKSDARQAGAITDNECEGQRFLIQKITYNKIPDLILYSEIYTEEELDKLLGPR